jgi:hypothetical protein
MLQRRAAALAPLAAVLALVGAPESAANPVFPAPGSGSAETVIDELTAQGYNVQINWVSGVSSRPLSECRVLAIHNPSDTAGPPTTFTTVYVDVSCPNHDSDGLILGGGLATG